VLRSENMQKYFSCPRLVFSFFFPNPAHKTKTRTANRWETTNNKPPGWSLWLANQNLEHIYYTLLWQVLGFAMPFTSLSKLCKNTGPNRHVLTLQRHILSTSWVALTSTLISSHWKYFVLISSVLWNLCCLYWNMLTEYRMKSSTIFSCTKGWWTEIHLVPAWKTICILWKSNSTLIVNMYNNGFN